MGIATFKSTAQLKENLRVEVEARGHKVIIDEPPALGGTDEGMNPLELLLSSLGACQSIVAKMYAEQFGIDLQNFSVELEGDIDTDGFYNKSDVRPGFLEVRYTMHIETNAPDEKVQKYIRFVEAHCPAGDSIAHTVKFQSNVVVVNSQK